MNRTDVTEDRAFDILAAYGADAARWPDAERAALAAAIAASPALQSALAEARARDAAILAMLPDWAPVAPDAAASAKLAVAARATAPHWGRWLGGGIAAAVAASLIAIAPLPMPWAAAPEQQGTPTTVAANAAADADPVSDAEAYAMLFTLTPQEESLI